MSKKLAIIALLGLTFVMAKAQTVVSPIPDPHMSFVNAVGLACAGCKLSTFAAGTTTPLATFTDSTGAVQNTNPVILDLTGSANIWGSQAAYKFVLTDPIGNLLFTEDNIPVVCTVTSCPPPTAASIGAVSLTDTSAQTLNGALSGPTINNVQYANAFTGATASEKINACLAAAGGGGTCDATGLTGVQNMDANVSLGIGTGASIQTLLVSKSTTFQPTIASMTMFSVGRSGAARNLQIFIPSALGFTGVAVATPDTIVNSNIFSIDGLTVNAGTYVGGGTGLLIEPSSGGLIELTNIRNIQITGLENGVAIQTNGSGSFINGNNFSDWVLAAETNMLTLNAVSGSTEIAANNWSNLQIDSGTGCGITYSGSVLIQQNNYYGHIFDTTTPICNSNSQALENYFKGHIDQPVTDANASINLFPTQNVYELDNVPWTQFNASGINIDGAPAFKARNAASFGWNFNGNGESDYFNNIFTGTTAFVHQFWAANSSSNGYVSVGGPLQNGTWALPAISTNLLGAAAIDQPAASSTGGQCSTASGSNTCTLTITHTYISPICVATPQATVGGVFVVSCTVSGNVVTVTASTTAVNTYGFLVFGNPT